MFRIDLERNFLSKGAKNVHTLEDLTISNLPDGCNTLYSCKLWDTSALLHVEPNIESFSCIALLKKADMAEMYIKGLTIQLYITSS